MENGNLIIKKELLFKSGSFFVFIIIAYLHCFAFVMVFLMLLSL